MRLHMALLAIAMFWKEPIMLTLESAKIILVRVAFSIVNLVLPPFPATLPIALER